MANPDYDPIKAHEYYMKHRKLKGRRKTTKGFTESQKEQWAYVKDQLKESAKEGEANAKTDIENRKKKQLEAIKRIKIQQKERAAAVAAAKIESLKQKLKNFPPEKKAEMRAKISATVENIKSGLAKMRDKISADFEEKKKIINAAAVSEKKQATQKANEQHQKDLDDAYNKIKGG